MPANIQCNECNGTGIVKGDAKMIPELKKRLDEIEAIVKAAIPGPFEANRIEFDKKFLINSRTYIPFLITELRRANEQIQTNEETLNRCRPLVKWVEKHAVPALKFYGDERSWYSDMPDGSRSNEGLAQQTVLWSMATAALAALDKAVGEK